VLQQMAGEENLSKQQKDSAVTRSSTRVWLLGQQIPSLTEENCNQLPTNGEVLRRLHYDLKTNKLCLTESCSNTIDKVLELWRCANIPTTQKPNAIAKLRKAYMNPAKGEKKQS
jgi:hypothetical protein